MRSVMMILAGVMLACPAIPARGQVIHEERQLLAGDRGDRDLFGWSVAIDNGVLAVGAPLDDENGENSGAAYLFDVSTGVQLAKLLPEDGGADQQIGGAVALWGGVVAVGADVDDDNGTASGSVYLFDVSTGAQLVKLLPHDGRAGDRFGRAVAVGSGVVAVGSVGDDDNGSRSGSVYLFDVSTGAQLAKLLPGDGTKDDRFGVSLAIDNGVVAIGAWGDDDNGPDSGSVHLFDIATGTQLAKLLPHDGAADEWFGFSIAIDNGVVAVGAPLDDDNGAHAGSAYLFEVSGGAELTKLLASDGGDFDWFGMDVALDDGTVAVGTALDQVDDTFTISAYLFDTTTGVQTAKLLPRNGGESDVMGWPVALDNGVAVVGAFWDDVDGMNTGSVYVFDTECPADLTRDGEIETEDFLAFQRAWSAGDLLADWNVDGLVNTQDFIAYLGDWAAGCP